MIETEISYKEREGSWEKAKATRNTRSWISYTVPIKKTDTWKAQIKVLSLILSNVAQKTLTKVSTILSFITELLLLDMVCLGCMACTQLMEFRVVGSLLCCQCFLFSSACQGREGKRIFCVLMQFFWLFRLESVCFLTIPTFSQQPNRNSRLWVCKFWIMKGIYHCHFGFFSEYPEIFIPFFWENWLYLLS